MSVIYLCTNTVEVHNMLLADHLTLTVVIWVVLVEWCDVCAPRRLPTMTWVTRLLQHWRLYEMELWPMSLIPCLTEDLLEVITMHLLCPQHFHNKQAHLRKVIRHNLFLHRQQDIRVGYIHQLTTRWLLVINLALCIRYVCTPWIFC